MGGTGALLGVRRQEDVLALDQVAEDGRAAVGQGGPRGVSNSTVSIRALVAGPVHAAVAKDHSAGTPGWPGSEAATVSANEAGRCCWAGHAGRAARPLGLPGGPVRRHDVAQLRSLAAGVWQVAVPQHLLAHLDQRIRTTLPSRPPVGVALPAGTWLQRGQQRLAVARGQPEAALDRAVGVAGGPQVALVVLLLDHPPPEGGAPEVGDRPDVVGVDSDVREPARHGGQSPVSEKCMGSFVERHEPPHVHPTDLNASTAGPPARCMPGRTQARSR